MLFTCAITLLGHPLSSRCLPAVGVAPSTTGGVPTILLRGAPSDALHIIYSIHVLCTVSWMWFTGCTEVGGAPSGHTGGWRRGIPILELGLSGQRLAVCDSILPPPNSLWVYILPAGTTE